MDGYVKLHRKILYSNQFADPIRLKIWIWCLLKANHKKKSVALKTGKGYTTVNVNRGQFVFGRNKASLELDIAGSTIVRHLEKLKAEKAINIKADNQYSVITICKYDDYQYKEDECEPATDKLRTSFGLASDTTKNDNNEKKKEVSTKTDILLSELKSSDFDLGSKELDYFKIAISFVDVFKSNKIKLGDTNLKSLEQAKYKAYTTPIRLILESDGYKREDLKLVYKYLNGNECDFWRKNVLSTEKLRKQFQQLVIASKNPNQLKTINIAEQVYTPVSNKIDHSNR